MDQARPTWRPGNRLETEKENEREEENESGSESTIKAIMHDNKLTEIHLNCARDLPL